MFQVGVRENDVGCRAGGCHLGVESSIGKNRIAHQSEQLHIQGGEEGLRASSSMEAWVVT